VVLSMSSCRIGGFRALEAAWRENVRESTCLGQRSGVSHAVRGSDKTSTDWKGANQLSAGQQSQSGRLAFAASKTKMDAMGDLRAQDRKVQSL
jgi:hypothetical protein